MERNQDYQWNVILLMCGFAPLIPGDDGLKLCRIPSQVPGRYLSPGERRYFLYCP